MSGVHERLERQRPEPGQRRRPAGCRVLLALAAALALATVFSLYLGPGFVVGFSNLIFVCQ